MTIVTVERLIERCPTPITGTSGRARDDSGKRDGRTRRHERGWNYRREKRNDPQGEPDSWIPEPLIRCVIRFIK